MVEGLGLGSRVVGVALGLRAWGLWWQRVGSLRLRLSIPKKYESEATSSDPSIAWEEYGYGTLSL